MEKTPNRPARPRDPNQLGKLIVDLATGDATETPETKPTQQEKWASEGGQARASKLTPEERKAIAQKGAKARWER